MSAHLTEGPLATPALSEDERAAAFRRVEPKVPRNFALIVLAVFAVLGLGGVLGEHLLSSVGLNPASTAPGASTVPRSVTAGTAVVAPPAPPSSAQEVGATLPAFMGISVMTGTPAPAFTLVDQSGKVVSLADERGNAVVVTFFDSPCQDICSVMSAEIRQADDDLGSAATHVVFLTVNTDPLVLSAGPASAAATHERSRSPGQLALPDLEPREAQCGLEGLRRGVTVAPTSKLVAHNDVMDFIDPTGRLRYRATPFADESPSGAYSLSPTDVARWGEGIATYTRRLLGSTP